MTNVDLTRLPTGEMGWARFVEWATASDDRVERYFLELKSDVDLNVKKDRHKVAKWVLGAANRDPARAAKRFGGCALMLLGVSKGATTGIPGFEAKDLAREVQKFTGADGPEWDFERIPVDESRDVVVIVVEPPTGRIWPCLADGEGLVNGDVYLRGDGETHKATGAELQAMLARTAVKTRIPEVRVELMGPVNVIRADSGLLSEWIGRQADEYLARISAPASSPFGGILSTVGSLERRTKEEFEGQVARWRERASADPFAGIAGMAASLGAGIRLRVTNSKVFLRDVRVDIAFDGEIRALEWLDRDDASTEVFPDRPRKWGTDSYDLASLSIAANVARIARDMDGVPRIVNERPAKLSMSMAVLRPDEDYQSEDDEVVLAIIGDGALPEHVTARWRLTAGDIDDVLEGEVEVPGVFFDWVEPLRDLLVD
ncbi:hypothetical protein [Gryllotalpicola protaetiae]|uniref:Uncharacterized protein n=1 Tax=Gryllotalpicola protaetiae TaxID=2419771 RepID=A0A387BPA9_9MICO|nr:hypothetical protein [Gryllotalpicola protaetiae]AYG03884.1 hypothetical protein D7I44_10285 [Gryllotalpicola protaetiae]